MGHLSWGELLLIRDSYNCVLCPAPPRCIRLNVEGKPTHLLQKKLLRSLGILRRLNQNPHLIWLVVSATELMSCKYSPSKGRAEPLKPARDPPRTPQPPATDSASRQGLGEQLRMGACVPPANPPGPSQPGPPSGNREQHCSALCVLAMTERA